MFDISIARQNDDELVVSKFEVTSLETLAIPYNSLFTDQRLVNHRQLLNCLGNALSISSKINGSNWSNDKDNVSRKTTVCLFAMNIGYNVSGDEESDTLKLNAVDVYLEEIFPKVEGNPLNQSITSIVHVPSNKPVEHIFIY